MIDNDINNDNAEPKPTDFLYEEQEPKKSLTILNNTNHTIHIFQAVSTWSSVKIELTFIIESEDTPTHEKTSCNPRRAKYLGELWNNDTIELTFNPPNKNITP